MQPIKLNVTVRNLGPVPSFKNNKMICRGRLITNPKRQKWMEQCIRSIESQLLCDIPTTEEGTLTGQRRLSWIACNMPLDDSRQWIPEIVIKSYTCDKGWDGFSMEIEQIG